MATERLLCFWGIIPRYKRAMLLSQSRYFDLNTDLTAQSCSWPKMLLIDAKNCNVVMKQISFYIIRRLDLKFEENSCRITSNDYQTYNILLLLLHTLTPVNFSLSHSSTHTAWKQLQCYSALLKCVSSYSSSIIALGCLRATESELQETEAALHELIKFIQSPQFQWSLLSLYRGKQLRRGHRGCFGSIITEQ